MKDADIRACKIYEIWTLSTGIFREIQWIYFKKSLLVFFQRTSLKYAEKLPTQYLYAVVYEYLNVPYNLNVVCYWNLG